MIMYKIVIFMFLLNPAELDALDVLYKDGKVLEFSNKEKCYEHIHNNLVELKKYAASEFGPATPVKMIDCFKKNEI